MNELISKELLSLVLNEEIKEINSVSKEDKFENILWYNDYEDGINIDTLGRLCKEWYYENALGHSAWLCPKKDKTWEHNKFALYVNGHEEKYVYGDTELEAIIKATKWIANKKGLL